MLAIAGIHIEGYSKSLDSPKESIRPASGGMIEPSVMYYHTFNQS